MRILKQCNYQEVYKRELKQGISIIEKGEKTFPDFNSEESEVFMSIGETVNSSIAFIGSAYPNEYEKELIKLYSAEALLNGYPVTIRSLFGSENSVLSGALISNGSIRVILDMGLGVALKKYKQILSLIVLNSGQILSPFESNEEYSYETKRYCDTLISNLPLLVFFSLSKREYELALLALDKGNDIVLHRNSLKDKRARRLVAEGALVTDSFQDLLRMCSLEPKGYLYKDKEQNLLFFKV